MSFPDGILFGVATAGNQIEGGFWLRPEEALDRAAGLGCNAFRLSVEWPRLEPEPDASDQTALDGYLRILDACHDWAGAYRRLIAWARQGAEGPPSSA